MDTVLPQSGAWTQYFLNQEHGHSKPQSRMEKDKDKHLHDMVQKYCEVCHLSPIWGEGGRFLFCIFTCMCQKTQLLIFISVY